jgi:hypothetical protein
LYISSLISNSYRQPEHGIPPQRQAANVSGNFTETTMRHLTICFLGLFLTIACGQTNKIKSDSIDFIELVQVDHPYLGSRVDSIKLESKLVEEFLSDFADKKEEVTKFFSCYVIKIHLKDGQLISYRTNGKVFEKFKDDNTKATYFKLNKDINLVTRYWGIEARNFCTRPITSAYIKGKWYLNKWTMYHTLVFSDKTVFVDNHVDSVFTVNYTVSNDTLILRDNDSTIQYKNKIVAITKDTLVIKSFGSGADTLGYSRTKREWQN